MTLNTWAGGTGLAVGGEVAGGLFREGGCIDCIGNEGDVGW